MMLRPLSGTLARYRRLGAGGDDDVLGADSRSSPRELVTRMVCGSTKLAVPISISTLLRESCAYGDVDFGLDHVLDAEGQIRHGDLFFHAVVDAVDALVVVAGKMQHGFAHGLAGNGAGVDADAADALRAAPPRATRFPDLAPWMAARWPAGPEPITIRSKVCIAGTNCTGLPLPLEG